MADNGLVYLECPCCGDEGAVSDVDGCFADGQPLICGCKGWVSVCADGDDGVWINADECDCEETQ